MEEKVFDSEFFNRLNRMKMLTKMRLNAGMGGQRKSSAKGSSVEFSDFREYIPGDDIRRIDWNVYGRMDKLFVKQFMEEKEGLFHIIVDCSKSMDFGEKNKSIFARQIAGMICYMVLNNLDRIYLTTLHGKKVDTTKGMTGRQAFPKILKQLEAMEFYGETNLYQALKTMPFKHRGVVVIISDFLRIPNINYDNSKDEVEELEKGEYIEQLLKYLCFHKQEVILIQVLSKEEENPLSEGTLEFIDSETEEKMKVTVTNKVLKQYEASLKELQNNINRLSKKYQVNYISITTEESIEAVIYKGIHSGQWGSK